MESIAVSAVGAQSRPVFRRTYALSHGRAREQERAISRRPGGHRAVHSGV